MTLRPLPIAVLARRAFRELESGNALFDLPSRRFFLGDSRHDLSVPIHGRRASTPFGPAAGPHSQLAQNIVLAWLAGGRVIELKTVQVRDDLVIPRPCIDMQTVGFNIEWSQELRLEESLEEYVKAWMLIRLLVASGRLPMAPGSTDTVFDLSVGYDLAGITSERVAAFITGMRDASGTIDRLRRQLPPEAAEFRDVDVDARLSDSLTLSTFHGCPPDEIERIVTYLFEAHRLHVVVKLNPTLLGPAETSRLLHDVLGYHELRVPAHAFERDTTWPQMIDFVGRLGERAATLGLGFGVKFTNTLIVENHRDFFPASEREMYLSGPPLHVLAVELVRRFRASCGDRVPVSFSAGIDRSNFAEAVALGLAPVTVCTDLLKPGGYGRARGYLDVLIERMMQAGASTIDEFIVRAGGLETHDHHPVARAEAVVAATERYARRVAADPRYRRDAHLKVPRKIGRHLALFDCISCDKCIPVCPNDANFTFVLPRLEVLAATMRCEGGGWVRAGSRTLTITETHQIGNFADFCNDCGNCDVFCPEDGGPYNLKPRVFGSEAAWRSDSSRDGFFVARNGARTLVLARLEGSEFTLELRGREARLGGPGFVVTFDERDPEATIAGEASRGTEVDLGRFHVMHWIARGLLDPGAVNYVNCLEPQ